MTEASSSDIGDCIRDAKARLGACADLRDEASAASAKAQQAVTEARKATSDLSTSISEVNKIVASVSSFESEWEAFKRKFDDLNKLAIDKIRGEFGAGQSTRPAEMISEDRVVQVLSRAANLVVLTGAGISSESGIPTFRGADGFWTVGSQNYRPQELATWEKFDEMPEELWHWYQYRWGICRKAKPNPGHHALVELEKAIGPGFTLVTQNIDGLHRQAGSDGSRLYEIHGRIDEMRCDERIEGSCLHGLDLNDTDNLAKVAASIVTTPEPAADEKNECLPCCAACGIRQRPKILWFDESYNETIYGYNSVQTATEACDVLLIIGTQLTTGLPSRMVQTARSHGTIIIKMDTIVDLDDEKSKGMLHLKCKSGEALPRIVAEVKKMKKEPSMPPLAKIPDSLSKNTTAAALGQPLPTSPLQPLQGSPATSLRRSGSNAKIKSTVSAASGSTRSSMSSSVRSSSSSGSAVKARQRSPPQGSSALLKAAGSSSLLKGLRGCAEGFFVYGTLRPDDDSGAAWTKSFCEDMTSEIAFLSGASLYIDGSYPAVSLEETRCSVRGAFLQPMSDEVMKAKLAEADRIEGYPDLYDRSVVNVCTVDGVSKRAYLYHRTGRTDRANCVRIVDGDWMSRKR